MQVLAYRVPWTEKKKKNKAPACRTCNTVGRLCDENTGTHPTLRGYRTLQLVAASYMNSVDCGKPHAIALHPEECRYHYLYVTHARHSRADWQRL